jgi:hypothetical protein
MNLVGNVKLVYDFTAYASRRPAQVPNASLHDFLDGRC